MKPMIASGKLTDPAGLSGIAPTVPCVTWGTTNFLLAVDSWIKLMKAKNKVN